MIFALIFVLSILSIAILAGLFAVLQYLNWGVYDCNGEKINGDDGIKGWR